MNNFLYSFIAVLAYIANTVSAATFKVLCAPNDYGGTGVTVYVDGTPYQMTSANNDILYETTVDGTPSQYYYEVTGVPAQNELTLFGNPRTWDPKSTSTLYEVFGRRHTVGDDILQTIPRLYPPLPGYDKYSVLFQEGEIPVINVHMSQMDYNQLITLYSNDDVKFNIEFDYYTPYDKFHYTNVTLSLSGQGSKNQEKKPYKFDLSENKEDEANTEIFNRKEFKLRSLRYDESGIKNKLSGDIAESLGLPISQSAPCRLYINNKSYGLYEIADMYKKKFIRRFFDPEKNSDETIYGSLYKGVSGEYPAFFYRDHGASNIQDLYESVVEPTAGYDPHQDVLNMIEWLENLSPTASKAEIEKQFDVDMFLKYAIIEYLICQWDGYIYSGNNFLTYIEPNNGKYHFFSYDFDLTFGKWCKAQTGKFEDFVAHPNDEKHQKYGPELKRDPLLYTKIIQNPEIKPIFEDMIKDIVGNLFNIDALGPRIDYFHQFLKDDLAWDILSYNIIETQSFAGVDKQELPTMDIVEAQFTESGNIENLRDWIVFKSKNVAESYGINELKANPKHGNVGEKLMTAGSDGSSSNLTSSSDDINKKKIVAYICSLISLFLVLFVR